MLACLVGLPSASMSQARGTMFDQVIHHFFQNISADGQASRDEERSLSSAQELRIEVMRLFKDPFCHSV